MSPKVEKFLLDMESAAATIQVFTDGQTFSSYSKDLLLRSGVERQFEIIGEALNQIKKIAPEIADQIHESQEIIRFRNILIHGYQIIDHAKVWDTVEKQLPTLRSDLRIVLKR